MKCRKCNSSLISFSWNIFLIKMGDIIQCNNCKSCYKTNKILDWIFTLYYGSILFIIPIFFLYDYFDILLGDNYDLYAFILAVLSYVLIEYLLLYIIPIQSCECKKEDDNLNKKSFFNKYKNYKESKNRNQDE